MAIRTTAPFLVAALLAACGHAQDLHQFNDSLSTSDQQFASLAVNEGSRGVLDFFAGIDGSKQPQDFGANANLGVRGRISYSAPLVERLGLGFSWELPCRDRAMPCRFSSCLVKTKSVGRVFQRSVCIRERPMDFPGGLRTTIFGRTHMTNSIWASGESVPVSKLRDPSNWARL